MRKSGMNLLGRGKTMVKKSIKVVRAIQEAQPLIIEEAIEMLLSSEKE